ncbi:hypothetical protein V1506DRAFT_543376 [Lipomyces tetrasporus]
MLLRTLLSTSRFAGFNVHERIMVKVRRLGRARSLLIIVYIGHGIIDIESNRLQLISENGSQKMVWSMVHDPILPSTDDSTQNNLYALAFVQARVRPAARRMRPTVVQFARGRIA